MPSVTFRTIKHIFAVMQATYGSRWSAQYPEELMPATQEQWQRVLSKFELSDIKRGLETWKEDWPPNVFEFEKVCRKPPTGVAGILAAEQKKLPRPKYPKEKAREHLENLKKMIKDAGVVKDAE